MGANKPTRQTRDSSVVPSTKAREAIVKSSSTSKSNRKARSKASSSSASWASPKASSPSASWVSPKASSPSASWASPKASSSPASWASPKAPSETPSSIASPPADTRNEMPERKKIDTAPIYMYKVMQHLDIVGDKEFEDVEKITVLGTFENEKKATDAAFRQYKALAAFAGSVSTMVSRRDGMMCLKITQQKRGSRKEMKLEVVREVREIVSLLADAKDDASQGKTENKPVYAYKVIQLLNIEGDEFFKDVERFRVLGMFDDVEKANDAASRQHKFLAVFADSISFVSTSRNDDMLSLTMLQQNCGSRKEAKIEVQRADAKDENKTDMLSLIMLQQNSGSRKEAEIDVQRADAKDESKTDDKPVYVYNVVQYLDIVGDKTFEDLEKVRILGTFDDVENANRAAIRNYDVLTAFADVKSSRTTTRRTGRLSLTMFQQKGGSRKEMKIKVERKVRKSPAPREVFVVLCQDRVIFPEPGVRGNMMKRSILGIYQDLESAVERLQKEPSDLYETWKRELEDVDSISELDFFDREDSVEDGRTVVELFNAAANLVVKLSISVEQLVLRL